MSTPRRWSLMVQILSTTLLAAAAAACPRADETGPPPPGTHVGYYVTTTGSPSGNGSDAQPWDLPTALGHPSAVQPGDTIWVRAGTYQGSFDGILSGSAAAPIIVRAYPGERVRIDGSLTLEGAYTWYWGFEVFDSSPAVGGSSGVGIYGDYIKAINFVVHDASGNGFGFWSNGAGGEIYGSLIYNNGRNYNQDHGIYSQNAVGTKFLRDNVIFHNMTYGIHIYGSDASSLKGYHLEGNVAFNNGAISPNALVAPNLLLGGSTPAQGVVVKDNMTYLGSGSTGVLMGYDVQNADILLTGNYFMGGSPALAFEKWSQATVSGNTMYGTGNVLDFVGGTSNVTWGGNVYHRDASATAWAFGNQPYSLAGWKAASGLGASDQAGSTQPTGVKTFVRPNLYEPGMGYVIIYNWDQVSSVPVDVSSVITTGTQYVVYNVQALFGSPVLSGTYSGGSLNFPMAAVPAPAPIGGGVTTPPSTGPTFQVFVIVRTS